MFALVLAAFAKAYFNAEASERISEQYLNSNFSEHLVLINLLKSDVFWLSLLYSLYLRVSTQGLILNGLAFALSIF